MFLFRRTLETGTIHVKLGVYPIDWLGQGGKSEARNLITIVSGAFLFMDKGEHFILVLLCKANLEYREIFWLVKISYL